MTVQTCIALALAILCALYFLKDLLRSAARGGCGSGCGTCKTGCPVKKLGAIRKDLDKTRPGEI
jgi:epoxyqueuosine reductase QueG